MAHKIAIASLALAGALSLAFPSPSAGQVGRAPKSVALCLPPGKPAPVACGTVRAGQTIRLRIATTRLPTSPITISLTEDVAAGQSARTANLTIPASISRDGGYEITLPPSLCAGARDRTANFEIQRLMSSYNQAEASSHSLGTLTIAC